MANHMKKTWSVPISVQGSIIDVETSGLKKISSELLTFGAFHGNTIVILQRTDCSEKGRLEFEKIVNDSLDMLPRPFYAYNSSFEEEWLGTKIDHDLMAKWKILADTSGKKWPKASELTKMPHEYYEISVEATGKEIPGIWEKYCKDGNPSHLDKIVYHNLYDLIRESGLLLWDETAAEVLSKIIIEEKNKPRKIPHLK